MDCAGENNFGLTLACRRYILPRCAPKKNLHPKKVHASARTRAYRFVNPVILENKVYFIPDKKYKKLNFTMQSASS